MKLQALGYVGVASRKLEDWGDFAANLLGMQLADKTRGTLAFRMDDRKQRLVVQDGETEGPAFFGWEAADAVAMEAVAADVEKAGVKVARGSRGLADERRVKDLIVFADPTGNRVEVFHGAEATTEPFKPGRAISGFRTGTLGMGHAVLTAENIEASMDFYREVLGFKLTDYLTKPFKAYFFHLNPRHHSLAFIGTGKNGLHHLMIETTYLDDVGQAYDLLLGEPEKIGTTLGRHVNDHVTSFYAWSPSKFLFEYGWGGRTVDPGTWTPHERTEGPSFWGHDRSWLPPEARAEARAMRIKAAQNGDRAPVNVIEGNHRVAPGVCAWWDATARSA